MYYNDLKVDALLQRDINACIYIKPKVKTRGKTVAEKVEFCKF